MSTFYKTLNSLYEVDGDRVRRVSGDNDPTPNQAGDGEWQAAEVHESFVDAGGNLRLLLQFPHGYTITSSVVDSWDEGERR